MRYHSKTNSPRIHAEERGSDGSGRAFWARSVKSFACGFPERRGCIEALQESLHATVRVHGEMHSPAFCGRGLRGFLNPHHRTSGRVPRLTAHLLNGEVLGMVHRLVRDATGFAGDRGGWGRQRGNKASGNKAWNLSLAASVQQPSPARLRGAQSTAFATAGAMMGLERTTASAVGSERRRFAAQGVLRRVT